VDFRDYLHLFKGARLGVFLAIALHANDEGWAWPSYGLLAKEAGYNKDTVRLALADLCEMKIDGHRLLLRYQPQPEGGQFTSNRYLLFPSAQEVEEYEGAGVNHLGHETGGSFSRAGFSRHRKTPSPENPMTENLVTKKNQYEQETGGGVDGLAEEQETALEALKALGVEQGEALRLAIKRDPTDVLGWVAYARHARGLDSPAAFVVARLRAGEPEPTPRGDAGKRHDRRRFISGKYAEYIEH
jgi:hypothetical protein